VNALAVVQAIVERHRLQDETFTLVSHRARAGWRYRHRTAEQRLQHLSARLSEQPPAGSRALGATILRLGMDDLDRFRRGRDHVVSISSRLRGPAGRGHLALMDLHLDEFIPTGRLAAAVRTVCDERDSWLLRTGRHYHVYGDFLMDERQWRRWNLRFQMALVLANPRYVGYSLLCGCNLLRLNAGGVSHSTVPTTVEDERSPGPAATAAIQLAQRSHACQVRKNGEPVIAHLREVAGLAVQIQSGCAAAGSEPFEEPSADELYACGFLHDSIEDTDTDYEDVVEAAGPRVATWVSQISDDKRLPAPQRHAAYHRQIGAASRSARIVKLADLLSNLRGLTGDEGRTWIQRYLERVAAQLELIREGLDRCPEFEEAQRLVHAWRRRMTSGPGC
jgi:guanosine-3',5'-bis(diphosphate) 3'-pyrophosphohydrolase